MLDDDHAALPPHPRSPQRLLAQWLGDPAPIQPTQPVESAALRRAQRGYRASLLAELSRAPAKAGQLARHSMLLLPVAALLIALLAPGGLVRWLVVTALLLAALLLAALHRRRRAPALPGATLAAQFESALKVVELPAVAAPATDRLRLRLAALLPRLDAAVQSGRPSIDERNALNTALMRDLPAALRHHGALRGCAAAGEADRLLTAQLDSLVTRIERIDAALAAPLLAAARRHARVLANRH